MTLRVPVALSLRKIRKRSETNPKDYPTPHT